MSLIDQKWTIAPYPDGWGYSDFPLGNKPQPVWVAIPDFVLQIGTAFSVNIQQTYLTPSSGATVTLNGSLPSGWHYDGATTILSRDASGVAGSASAISFTADVSGIDADSVTFNVQSLAVGQLTAPRFGYVDLSPGNTSPQYGQARAQRVARGDTVLQGWYAGIGSECYGPGGNSLGNYVRYILSLNANVGVFPYILPDSDGTGGTNWPDFQAAVARNNWYLYNNWLNQAAGKVINYFNGAWQQANSTLASNTDTATGLKMEAFCARMYGDRIFSNSPASSDYAPECGGVFHDNVFPSVPDTGDFLQNGSSVGPSSPPGNSAADPSYRQGLASFAAQIIARYPGKLPIGNIARFALNTPGGGSVFTGLTGAFKGGLIENLLGVSYSPATFSGGNLAKSVYDTCMQQTGAPNRVGVGVCWNTNGQGAYGNAHGLPNFQDARFQAAFALQNDAEIWIGYPTDNTFTEIDYQALRCTPLDEFCVVGHTCQPEATPQLGKRYLGVRSSIAWKQLDNGVYATEYSDGVRTWIVFCNFPENSSRTFNIVTYWPAYTKLQKLIGTQAPSVNNGALVSSVTIGSYDALIGYLVA